MPFIVLLALDMQALRGCVLGELAHYRVHWLAQKRLATADVPCSPGVHVGEDLMQTRLLEQGEGLEQIRTV